MNDYTVTCQAGKYLENWVVTRVRDGKIMTQGSVTTCLRWVNVWGPMYAN